MKKQLNLSWSMFEKCPLCANIEFKKRFDLTSITVYECAKCRIKFLNPYLSQQAMLDVYSSMDALKETNKKLSHYYDQFEGSETEKFYDKCLRMFHELGVGGKLLDIGCGRGQFLSVAKKFGWSVTGLEPAGEHSNFAKNQLGIDVICSSLEDAHLESESFDVITLWDIIEHVPIPGQTILKISHWIKPEGLLLIATPNHQSLLNFLGEALFSLSRGLIHAPLNFLFVPEHILYFTPGSLKKLLNMNGLEIIQKLFTGTDIDRYNVSPLVKMIAKVLLPLAKILNAENRMIVIAKKTVAATTG